MSVDFLTAPAAPPTPWAAIVPLIAVLPAVICMIDIARHPHTRRYPPQVWLAICACGNVFGLVAYLRLGRTEDH
ncbi:PLDc N-terminal domain-containing protein [Streptomyces sp. NPDC048361]|uniref:PLDc N-terminal domain-containing protein n=1 Tax=Streptomyces sp. NPDC048361 TaxID=3154720 RepID=UPI0034471D43